jgi:predicted cobalt transporter CbtA
VRDIIEHPPEPGEAQAPLWKRLLWFAALAVAGTVGTALIAYGLKALLPAY